MSEVKQQIEELRTALDVASERLAVLPDVFGKKEIAANLGQSMRYICKFEDEFLCMRCKEEHGDEPTVPYYKARVHHSCFIEHFGQERFDRIMREIL